MSSPNIKHIFHVSESLLRDEFRESTKTDTHTFGACCSALILCCLLLLSYQAKLVFYLLFLVNFRRINTEWLQQTMCCGCPDGLWKV